MSDLKTEFQNILTKHTNILTSSFPQSTSINDTTSYELQHDYYYYNLSDDGLNPDTISHLRTLAQQMNLSDCVDVYKSARKQFVMSTLKQLGIEELSINDIRGLVWEDLKIKIEMWIRAIEVCFKIVFVREKKLCHMIFGGLGVVTDDTHDECFVELVQDVTIKLFKIGSGLSSRNKSYRCLFKVLDMYVALLNLSTSFDAEFGERVKKECDVMLRNMEKVVRGILPDFEASVVNEVSKVSDGDRGGVHSITKNVMDYVSQIVGYRKTLSGLIVTAPLTSFGDLVIPDVEFARVEGWEPLALHLVLIVVLLRFKLEVKSKVFKDVSLRHLFMLNNVDYMLRLIKRCPELRDMIGEDYLSKLSEHLREAMCFYQSSTCDRMLNVLRHEGLERRGCFTSGVSESALRKRISTFNDMFEEVYKTQETWAVHDLQLRGELRLSITQKLIPAYSSFLEQHAESRGAPLIKYSVEQLQNLILDKFLANDHTLGSSSGIHQELILGRKFNLAQLRD